MSIENKTITIWYADDLSTFGKTQWKSHYLCYEDDYMRRPMSERINWVENLVKYNLDNEHNLLVITNDYAFIRLLEHFTPNEHFCIYHADSDCVVNAYVDLNPNPTLDVDEYLFRIAVKKALKKH